MLADNENQGRAAPTCGVDLHMFMPTCLTTRKNAFMKI